MGSNKKYWKSEEELNSKSEIIQKIRNDEFVEQIPVDEFLGDKESLESSSTSRRDFLKYVGFTTAAASLAACKGPVNKTIPYVVQPEQIRPGIPDYYATTIANGFDFTSVLVKTREGRPIGIERNKQAPYRSCLGARDVAFVLSLYDKMRIQAPFFNGENQKTVSWSELDTKVVAQIKKAKSAGKKVVILTNTMVSPSASALISQFSEKFGGIEHVIYDAVSSESAQRAFEKKYGVRALADYNFKEADCIVSFGADFIGDWQGGSYQDDYAKMRIPKNGKMSRHIQFESNMSLSGSNADERIPLKPSQIKLAFTKFYAKIAGQGSVLGDLPSGVEEAVNRAAKDFLKAGDKAVVVTDIFDENAQLLALELNEKVASKVLDLELPLMVRQGNLKQVKQLISDMNNGDVGVLITSDVNPVYTMPVDWNFSEGLSKVDFSVAFSQKLDETSSKVNYIAASSHNLESWGDTEMKKGYFTLVQPTIQKLFDTRQLQDSLLKWVGSSQAYYDFLKSFWKENILNGASFNQVLHDGFFEGNNNQIKIEKTVDVDSAFSQLKSQAVTQGLELVLYTKLGIGDGQQANNPWLQEFPDPITRVSWDNYITLSKADADSLGTENWHVSNGALDGHYANIKANGVTLKVPVIIQPGQAKGSIGLALGYGRKEGLKKEMQTGVNAYKVYQNLNNVQSVEISKASGTHKFSCIQLHNTLMGRGDIVKETTLNKFINEGKDVWNEKPKVSLNHQEVPASTVSIWDNFDRSVGHHFNLSIDLNACTGCGACVIACHAENNVPVVGKKEVRMSRDMHWLRIDRYYSSEKDLRYDLEKKENISGLSASMSEFGEMEKPSENPQVVFQPVMCQHCNHAPCETVCPVAATSHSRQGQNHMAYNRCVGTRYCANNCPYKVRRFNWFLYNNNDEFDYHMNNDLGKMVLNPDVVVRSRGVMEKCSFCIQRTQTTILKAKNEGREVYSNEFDDATACAAACGSGAMIFGDVNNKESKISELRDDDRAYHLLEHVGTQPNVFYHVKVRNIEEV